MLGSNGMNDGYFSIYIAHISMKSDVTSDFILTTNSLCGINQCNYNFEYYCRRWNKSEY